MKCFFLAVLSLAVSSVHSFGQISVTTIGSSAFTLDFSSYTGGGLHTDPTAVDSMGYLDSDDWLTYGVAGVDSFTTAGQTKNGGRYGRGEHNGETSQIGLTSFDVSNGGTLNRTLGVKPNTNSGKDERTFNPGVLELRMVNNTGSTITGLNFIFDVYEFNQRNSEYQLDFKVGISYAVESADGYAGPATPTSASHVTEDGRDAGGDVTLIDWVKTTKSGSVLGLGWTVGSELFLRWEGSVVDDLDTNMDLVALDNISITAIPEPSTYALIFGGFAIGVVVFVKRRRAVKDSA
mgnify:CR=1 FL=1